MGLLLLHVQDFASCSVAGAGNHEHATATNFLSRLPKLHLSTVVVVGFAGRKI